MTISMFARRKHFADHLAPIWFAIPEDHRGDFWVPAYIESDVRAMGINCSIARGVARGHGSYLKVDPGGSDPILCAAYDDMERAFRANKDRWLGLMEHGCGLAFSEHSHGYPGGQGLRRRVGLFLSPNEFIRAKTAHGLPKAKQVVIGTPKLDAWVDRRNEFIPGEVIDGKPTVAVSFHWNGERVCPEAGNAWRWYVDALPSLTKTYHMLGHGHPKILRFLAPYYEAMGFEVVEDFNEVARRACVYVNDCSSTLYEFCVTGKPVVILNAPWFDKKRDYGIRFWKYTDIGPQVEHSAGLKAAIDTSVKSGTEYYAEARSRAISELYPNLGTSARIAADALLKWIVDCK